MKYLKMLGLAVMATMSFMAFAANSASATTLETTGVTYNTSEIIVVTLTPGTSAILKDTAGFASNTCTGSEVGGATASPFSGTSVTGALSTLTFTGCTRPTTVHKPGKLECVHIAGTTDCTLYSEEAEVTTGSPIGTLNCKTGATTHVGTLKGVKHGHATIEINAVINCGIIPSAKWEAHYTVTSPTGLGVSA